MKIEIENNYEEISKRAARITAREILVREDPVLGLPTGDTPKGMYELLVEYYQSGLIDFSKVKTFNLDEYYPMSKEDPNSFGRYLEERLLSKVNIGEDNIHLIDGSVPRDQVETYCGNYEEKIDNLGRADLSILGIGENGHIAFNEPGSGFQTATRLVDLEEGTIRRNFENPDEAPNKAITVGIKTIMNSGKILLLAAGEQKSKAIEKSVAGPVTEEWPASILQLHPNVTFLLDEKAANF